MEIFTRNQCISFYLWLEFWLRQQAPALHERKKRLCLKPPEKSNLRILKETNQYVSLANLVQHETLFMRKKSDRRMRRRSRLRFFVVRGQKMIRRLSFLQVRYSRLYLGSVHQRMKLNRCSKDSS